jgi:hypothetical protein
MSRGIMKHGTVKTFFTRGILGGIFRPILYTKIDKINYEFVGVITETIKGIDTKVHNPNKMALQIWFSMAPLEHFELLFLPDKNNSTIIPMLEKAEISNGKECAYLTQGFMLFYLEQLLKNSPEYRGEIKTSIEDIDNTCNIVFGENNKVLKYLNYFRNTFDRSKIDPRDEPIIYVYRATELFIPDSNRKKAAIKDWDDDIIGKFSFINGFTEFIITQKENSLKMMN